MALLFVIVIRKAQRLRFLALYLVFERRQRDLTNALLTTRIKRVQERSLRSWRFCGRSINMKAAKPRKRALLTLTLTLTIPLGASPLVFAAPPFKLTQNRQLRRLTRARRVAWVYPRPQGRFEEMYGNPVMFSLRKNDFRVSKETFDYICQLVGPYLSRQNPRLRKAIPF